MSKHEWDDKRGHEHMYTHTVAIAAHDYFMSGWGHAKHRSSLCVWVCRPEHADEVEHWVRSRGEMHDVCRHEIASSKDNLSPELVANWFPEVVESCQGPVRAQGSPLIAIYTVDDNHPALVEEEA